MAALVRAAEAMGGGGREPELEREALRAEGRDAPHEPHAHYAKAARELCRRGLLRREVVAGAVQWWLTDDAWRSLGRDGPAPRPPQGTLL